MEGMTSKNFLFEKYLPAVQVDKLAQLDPQLLTQLLARSGKHFFKCTQKHYSQIDTFLLNYQSLLASHARLALSEFSNNLGLHFALLSSHSLLTKGHLSQAQAVLAQTQQYLRASKPDPELLSISLCNLATLSLHLGDDGKAVTLASHAVRVMQTRMQKLHKLQYRSQMMEDAVILVCALRITQKGLQKALKRQNTVFMRSLLKEVNQAGLLCSHKYLGKESILARHFAQSATERDLPVLLPNSSRGASGFESKVLRELETIQNLIKDSRYVSCHESSPIRQIVRTQEHVLIHKEIFKLFGWQVGLQILSEEKLNPKEFQVITSYFGHWSFTLTKGNKSILTVLGAESVSKVLLQINASDVLPYQMNLFGLSPKQFIATVLSKFIRIDSLGNLQISPRMLPLFSIVFCKEPALCFFSHVRYNQFRVAICPQNSSQTLRLELEFQGETENGDLRYQPYFCAIEKKMQKIFDKFSPQSAKEQIKLISTDRIREIVMQFQLFVIEESQKSDVKIHEVIGAEATPNYYRYVEDSQGKGRFYLVRCQSAIQGFDLYLQNTFDSFDANAKSKAKGTCTYFSNMFLKQFGFDFGSIVSSSRVISEILSRKHELKIFYQPLQTEKEDLYCENAIVILPLTSKCYCRRLLQFEDYLWVVTIEVVLIKSQIPVGVAVSAYEPTSCAQLRHFLYLVPYQWQKQVKSETHLPDPLRQNYFLAQWLEAEGFDQILAKIRLCATQITIGKVKGLLSTLNQFLTE